MADDNDNTSKRFENFGVWQTAHDLVIQTHRLTSLFDPLSRDLRDRLVDAAHLVTKAFVEGYNRREADKKLEFYEISRDATFVYQDVLLTARDLNLFTEHEEDYSRLLDLTIESRKRITGLIKRYRDISRS
jgi:four helix bundle protein